MTLKGAKLPLTQCVHCYLVMRKYTHQQKIDRLLLYIDEYITHHGFAPTVEEMQKAMKLTAKSSTAYCRDRLVKKGLLDLERGKQRGVVITPKGKIYLDKLNSST